MNGLRLRRSVVSSLQDVKNSDLTLSEIAEEVGLDPKTLTHGQKITIGVAMIHDLKWIQTYQRIEGKRTLVYVCPVL